MSPLMRTFPAAPDEQVTLANWRTAPFNRWSFHHVRELLPSATIRTGASTWALPRRTAHIDRLRFADRDGEARELGEVLENACTDALLVMHRGRIVHEEYRGGMREDDPHILMSVSKSVTGAVAGVLIERGVLSSGMLVCDVLPELEASVYGDVSLQQLLDMRAGVDFDEDYLAASGPMIDYRRSAGWNPPAPGVAPGDLRSFVASLGRTGRHGGPFRYISPNTDLMGWVIERASGVPFARLLSELIWVPMGAEHAAYVTVDALGAPRVAGGICATLRDLARLGQTVLDHGVANGVQVLPAEWVRDMRRAGDPEAWRRGDFAYLLPGGRYRNFWYQAGDDLDATLGLGIHGQFLYVSPVASVVIAHFASHPVPLDDRVETQMIDAMAAIARALSA